jgi:UDP-2,3-diacylglucosamine pyrophosphatase LpxH
MMKRREFISKATHLGGMIVLPWAISANREAGKAKKLRIGIIADLHQDIMHDGIERLSSFIDHAKRTRVHSIMQMGDFCIPEEENKELMDVWNAFQNPAFHILGNHDMDGGHARQETMEFWGMQDSYYSFDLHGYHFIILDGNDPNPQPWSGYNRYIDKKQQEWLREDLSKTKLNTFVFSHQTIENEDGGVANFLEIRNILEDINRRAGEAKVVACFSGHHHTDYMTAINGIYYIQINSASYRWVGEEYQFIRYSKEIDKKYPWIKYTIPYKDPLFTIVDIDPEGFLKLEPRNTEFVGPGPEDMGGPETAENDPIVPKISDFYFNFNAS